MLLFRISFRISFILFIFLGCNQLFSQSEFNRWATAISADQLTEDEISLINSSDYETSGTNLQYVRFSDVNSLDEAALYSVKLTNDGLDYAFDVGYVEVYNSGEYYISGIIAGNDASFTYLPGEGIEGEAVVNGQVIRLDAISEGLSTIKYADEIIEIDSFEDHCIDYVSSPTLSSTVDMCAAVVDVLYLRTSQVEESFPFTTTYGTGWDYTVSDFATLVRRDTRWTNEALANSGIGSKRINAIIHEGPIDEILEHSSSAFTTHTRLRQSLVVQQLRQQYDADVVVMYFYDLPGSVGGIANDGLSVPAVYSTSYISNEFLTSGSVGGIGMNNAHELGHVFGGHHPWAHALLDPDTGEQLRKPTVVRNGHGIPWGDRFQTIKHYSNEHVDYILPNGRAPTGTEDRDNAIRISNNFCTVAEFEQSGTLASFIRADWGPSIPLCFTTLPLCADVVSGNTGGPNSGPYTYEWRYSLFPNSTTTFFSYEECPTFVLPNINFTTYYVTLDVTDIASGQSTSTTKIVRFFYPCDNDFDQLSDRTQSKEETFLDDNKDYIYQVGINSSRRIFRSKLEASQVELVRIDGSTFGSVKLRESRFINFDLIAPPGLYYLVFRTEDGQVETHPVWHVH